MSDFAQFSTYINSVSDNDHFSPEEMLQLVRLRKTANVPPENLWSNIKGALFIANKLRKILNHPLNIGNGYRPKYLNQAAGGAKRSQHIWFRALDIDLPNNLRSVGVYQEDLYMHAVELWLEYGKEMKLGLGIYRRHRGSRIHIDAGYKHRCWGGFRGSWVKEIAKGLR